MFGVYLDNNLVRLIPLLLQLSIMRSLHKAHVLSANIFQIEHREYVQVI